MGTPSWFAVARMTSRTVALAGPFRQRAEAAIAVERARVEFNREVAARGNTNEQADAGFATFGVAKVPGRREIKARYNDQLGLARYGDGRYVR